MHKHCIAICVLSASITLNMPLKVLAENHDGAPWSKACATYATPKDLVAESAEFCLRDVARKRCLERAEAYFESCRFKGNYRKISRKVHAKMLVVLALSRFGSMPDKKSS